MCQPGASLNSAPTVNGLPGSIADVSATSSTLTRSSADSDCALEIGQKAASTAPATASMIQMQRILNLPNAQVCTIVSENRMNLNRTAWFGRSRKLRLLPLPLFRQTVGERATLLADAADAPRVESR